VAKSIGSLTKKHSRKWNNTGKIWFPKSNHLNHKRDLNDE
jgi:hypothetical protein